jgi:hypothetical protein
MRPAKHRPDPVGTDTRDFERETGGIKPPPIRREGWLGNPPWLKPKDENEKKDQKVNNQ